MISGKSLGFGKLLHHRLRDRKSLAMDGLWQAELCLRFCIQDLRMVDVQWMDTWRWHAAMNRGRHRIPMEGWRKSSQWMGLIRDHAEIFVNDTVIDELFKAYCVPSNACYSGLPPTALQECPRQFEQAFHLWGRNCKFSQGVSLAFSYMARSIASCATSILMQYTSTSVCQNLHHVC